MVRQTSGISGQRLGARRRTKRRLLAMMAHVSFLIYSPPSAKIPVYPIRTTVTNYLETFPENPLVIRHEHPGYFLWPPDSARENPLETYDLNHPLYAKHLALREDFARGMREARICVFDASLERKMIRKVGRYSSFEVLSDGIEQYAQALLSGCVIAGDLHTEHEEALEGFTIQLKPTWDIERIHQELEKYLADEDRLHQMAVDGFVYARSHLTAM